jgi:hypothetical protein
MGCAAAGVAIMGNREWGIATLAARWLGFVNARCGGRGARRTRAVARGVLGARVSAHVAPISARVPGKSRALVPLMWVCKRGVFGFALVSKGVASASSRHTSAIICGLFFFPHNWYHWSVPD